MAVTILYLFIFGLISCTSGKPADDSFYGIEGLLKELAQQKGKFDIALSHHEDGPKSHHEDRARITPHTDNAASDESEESTNTNLQSIYNLQTKPDKVAQPENSLLIQKLSGCTDITKCKNLTSLQLASRILGLLSDGNLRNDEDNKNDLRCAGDRCDRDTDDDNGAYITVRCVGDRCGVIDDDRENLRCLGNRCGDTDDDRENLRCSGNRCGGTDDDRENLRCSGNRCGTSRDDAPCNNNRCNRNDGEVLRCNGNRCNNDNEEGDSLRCSGNRCGRNRDDSNVGRCRGKACSAARYNGNNDRNDDSQWQPKRVKLNDNVDAVILDVDDLQHLLSGSSRNEKLVGTKYRGSKDLENILNNKKTNIDTDLDDAYVESRNDKYDLVKQIKRLLTQGSAL